MLGNVIYKDSMHSFTTHESRNLKQARPQGQYVDLLLIRKLATPSQVEIIITPASGFVKTFAVIMSFCSSLTKFNVIVKNY